MRSALPSVLPRRGRLHIKRVELRLVHRLGGVLDTAVFDRAQRELKVLIRRTGLNAAVGR